MSNTFLVVLNTQPVFDYQDANYLINEALRFISARTPVLIVAAENPFTDIAKITHVPLEEFPPTSLSKLTDYMPAQSTGWYWTTSQSENLKFLKQAKRIFDFPAVVSHHDAGSSPVVKSRSSFARWLFPWQQSSRINLSPTDTLVTTSLVEADAYAAGAQFQVKTIPWGVDPSKFRFKRSFQPPYDLLASDPLDPNYRKHLFQTIALLPSPEVRRVTLIANKSEYEALRKMSLSEGIVNKVKIVSVYEFSDLPKLFSTSDLYLRLMPDSSRDMTFLYAQAAGLPVLVADNAFVQEYQPKRNHMLNLSGIIPAKTSKRIMLLLRDADIRITAVKRSMAFTRKYFTWPQIARYYLEIFFPTAPAVEEGSE